MEKLDKNWYCQVLKGAKYSRVGDSFIEPNQNIKCVRIHRPPISDAQESKPKPVARKPPVKREISLKKPPKSESQSIGDDTNRASPALSLDGHSSTGSSEACSSLPSVSEIVRQAQRLLPKLEMSPSCFSNPIAVFQAPKDSIDALNYDFSFTSPLIKSWFRPFWSDLPEIYSDPSTVFVFRDVAIIIDYARESYHRYFAVAEWVTLTLTWFHFTGCYRYVRACVCVCDWDFASCNMDYFMKLLWLEFGDSCWRCLDRFRYGFYNVRFCNFIHSYQLLYSFGNYKTWPHSVAIVIMYTT